MASYYRNIVAHHFLDRAMIELALFDLRDVDSRDSTDAFWARIDRLRDLFQFEFFYPPRKEHRAALESEHARIDPAWAKRLERGDRGVAQLHPSRQPLLGTAAQSTEERSVGKGWCDACRCRVGKKHQHTTQSG